ncbi:MAG: CDP-glycerol glycerophosphotransferase family protein [Chlamydiota bacterium]
MNFKRVFCFFFSCVLSLFGEPTDVLFYLQDAGETLALLPVIQKLEQKGIDYHILSAGVAREIVLKAGIPAAKISTFQDFGIMTIVDRNWGRSERLSDEEMFRFKEEIEAKEVITGVAFAVQGQVLDVFSSKGLPAFAYWDNFNAEGENPYFKTAHEVETHASILLLPSHALKATFMDRKTEVVGQPTLEEWASQMEAIDRSQIREKLEIELDQKVALFVGGYGDEYEDAFRLFLQGVDSLQNPSLLFLIQPHPKTGGKFEQELIAKENAQIRLLKGELTTVEAVALSDLVIVHQSTVAFQALAAKKPVLHILPPTQKYESLPLQKGLAKRVSSVDKFARAIDQAIGMTPEDFYELMQIPHHSRELCVEIILEALQ